MKKACFSLGEGTSRLCGPKLSSGVPWGAGNDLWQHEKTVGCLFFEAMENAGLFPETMEHAVFF